jgi:hypothetical protein
MKTKNLFKSLFLTSLFVLTVSCENDELLETLEENSIEKINEISSKTVNPGWAYWNRTDKPFQELLIDAINTAAWNDVIEIPFRATPYIVTKPFSLPVKAVTIKGINGKVKIKSQTSITSDGFITVMANATKFEDLEIDGSFQGGWSRVLIFNNGKDNITATGCIFRNSNFGFGSSNTGNAGGLPINGLKATNCKFINCKVAGIGFNRQTKKLKVTNMWGIEVIGCHFEGTMEAGITIDCGNDGATGNLTTATPLGEYVTNMGNMKIQGCTFQKATKYNIALAKVSNVLIDDCTLNGNISDSNYENINIEHTSSSITIKNSRLFNNGPNTNSHIAIVGYNDTYGGTRPQNATPKHENGNRNNTIENNTFTTNSTGIRRSISGEDNEDIFIRNNNFENCKVTLMNWVPSTSKSWPIYVAMSKGAKGNKNIVYTNNNSISPTTFMNINNGQITPFTP